MNYLFFILIASSIIISIFNGTSEELVKSMLDGCNLSVKIAFSLIGIMTFWLGVMRVAEKAGFIKYISNLFFPILRFLYKGVKKDSNILGNISMSIAANSLGLANAATPIGLKVMQELQNENENKIVATDDMCMFLAMNTAGFQIIPTTVIAILVGFGANNPTQIILPTLIVTTLAFFFSILIAVIFRYIWNKEVN